MTREIKFRAWNKTKEKSYFDTSIMEQKYMDSGYMTYFDIFNVNVPEKDYVLMQYTGLKDKNGVEIYEGDICKIKIYINKVEDWIYNSLTQKERETGEKIFVVESPLFNNQPELNADYIEVIGNIYENPELLEN